MSDATERPIDYVATAKSYGFRIDSRADFEAATDRPEGLLVRARHYDGTHVLWDPEDGDEGFMLVGDNIEPLAKLWFEHDFAMYPDDHQIVTYKDAG